MTFISFVTLRFTVLLCFIFIISLQGSVCLAERRYALTDSLPQNYSLAFQNQPLIRRAAAPTVLFATTATFWRFNKSVKNYRNMYFPDFKNGYDDYTQYLPAATVFALNLSGVKGKNNLRNTTLNWGSSMFVMGFFVNSIKYSSQIMRPDNSKRNSFISGHTATAFTNAAFLNKEYGHISPYYSVAGYTFATMTGVGRILNNKHWMADVLAGAGAGILSTELAYLLIDKNGEAFSPFIFDEEVEKPSFISIKMGAFKYLKNSYFYNSGVETTIEGAYFFDRHWGIGGGMSHSQLALLEEHWTVMAPELAGISSFDSRKLGIMHIWAGPYFATSLGAKVLFVANAGLGTGFGLTGTIQEMDNRLNNSNPSLEYYIKTPLIGGAGISFTGMITPKVGLSWFLDSQYTKPTFNFYFAQNSFHSGDLRFRKAIDIWNLSTGLALTSFF